MKSNANYRGGDEFHVPLGKQITDSIRLHELSHELLAKTTRWGIIIFLQTQLRRADRMYSRLHYHFSIGDILVQAAETTFESMAILNQILDFARLKDYESINEIMNSLCYDVYAFDYIDLYQNASIIHPDIANLCRDIPRLALSVDPFTIPHEKWNTPESLADAIMDNPKLYHPDTRFKILNETLNRLLKIDIPTQITEDWLIDESGLVIKKYEEKTKFELWDNLKNVMTSLFPNDDCVSEALIYIENSFVIGDVQIIIDQANSLDIPTPSADIETIYLKSSEPWLHNCDALIVLPYHELIILEYHIISEKKRYITACHWQMLKDIVELFNGVIILHEEDIDYIYEKVPELQEINLFFYFEGIYQSFKDCLKARKIYKPSACLLSIDEYTYALFVKLADNTMIFTVQNQNGTQLILSDIQSGFYDYVNDLNELNSCIFNNKQCEDAVKSILNISDIYGQRLII